jgi:hypothetical protein
VFPIRKDLVGLQDDNVYFYMNTFKMIQKKGEPLEKYYSEETSSVFYSYSEMLYEKECTVEYRFVKTFLFYHLYSVDMVIPVTDIKDGEKTFEQVCERLSKAYENKDGYYKHEIKDEVGLKSLDLGTNLGAVGDAISVSWFMKNNKISISIIHQY